MGWDFIVLLPLAALGVVTVVIVASAAIGKSIARDKLKRALREGGFSE